MTALVLIGVLAGTVAGLVAEARGRSFWANFVACVACPPLVVLLVPWLLTCPPRPPRVRGRRRRYLR